MNNRKGVSKDARNDSMVMLVFSSWWSYGRGALVSISCGVLLTGPSVLQ